MKQNEVNVEVTENEVTNEVVTTEVTTTEKEVLNSITRKYIRKAVETNLKAVGELKNKDITTPEVTDKINQVVEQLFEKAVEYTMTISPETENLYESILTLITESKKVEKEAAEALKAQQKAEKEALKAKQKAEKEALKAQKKAEKTTKKTTETQETEVDAETEVEA